MIRVYRTFPINIKTMKTLRKGLQCSSVGCVSLNWSCWGINMVIMMIIRWGQWSSNLFVKTSNMQMIFFSKDHLSPSYKMFARRCPMRSTAQLLQSLIKCLAKGHPHRPSPHIRPLIKHFSLSHSPTWLICLNLQQSSLRSSFSLPSPPHKT